MISLVKRDMKKLLWPSFFYIIFLLVVQMIWADQSGAKFGFISFVGFLGYSFNGIFIAEIISILAVTIFLIFFIKKIIKKNFSIEKKKYL